MEEPFRTIVTNAGGQPGRILAELDQRGPGYGFDALARRVVGIDEVGLYDAAPVVKGAVHTAIASAALALTTDVIVHGKNPPEMFNA